MVNPAYLEKPTLDQVKEYFKTNGFVSLQDFFDKKELTFISKFVSKKFKREDEPLTHRFSAAKFPRIFDFDFVSKVCGKRMKSMTCKAVKLGKGCYELRGKPKSGFEVVFCLNPWNDSFGGQVVYADDNTGDFFVLPTTENTFSVVKRGKSTSRFIKYVNHYAGNEELVLIFGELK